MSEWIAEWIVQHGTLLRRLLLLLLRTFECTTGRSTLLQSLLRNMHSHSLLNVHVLSILL